MLGSKIVAAAIDKGTFEFKAMVRSSNDSHEEKRQKIDEMKAKGAAIVEGDLIKPETLLGACAEVDVIVSAVGNNDVTVLGRASHFCSPPLEIGVRSQESGARRKEEEGRRKEPEEVFLQISDAPVLGQKNLIDAAKQQRVKRFIRSDYSVDYRKQTLPAGDNDKLDMPKQVFEFLFVALAVDRWDSTLKR
jgi:nucleoside-diphosphate-sugar epimerase